MLHTIIPASQLSHFPSGELYLAAVNSATPGGSDLSVTLCGTTPRIVH